MDTQLLRRLPTADDIIKLPRGACIAWAVRCAHRASELLVAIPGADVFADCVHDALQLCNGRTIDNDEQSVQSVHARLRQHSKRCAADSQAAAFLVVSSVLSALELASRGADSHQSKLEISAEVVNVARATFFAAMAHQGSAGHFDSDLACLLDAMNYDMDTLLDAACYENWTDNTPVPHDRFGPMWPVAVPGFWPQRSGLNTTRDGSGSSDQMNISASELKPRPGPPHLCAWTMAMLNAPDGGASSSQ